MKKQNKGLAPEGRAKQPRRLTLHRETIQRLSHPQLGGVVGGLAAHTFTGGNVNLVNEPNAGTMCG